MNAQQFAQFVTNRLQYETIPASIVDQVDQIIASHLRAAAVPEEHPAPLPPGATRHALLEAERKHFGEPRPPTYLTEEELEAIRNAPPCLGICVPILADFGFMLWNS